MNPNLTTRILYMSDIDTRIAFRLEPKRLPVYSFPMKTGMLYDPRRKVLYNFFPLLHGYYVVRKNADITVDDGLYIFSGDQEIELYDKSGFYVMYSSETWMTEHPVQMLSA